MWSSWAPDLARELVELWPWLDRVPRARVAATLGPRVGPEWTAAAVVDWVLAARRRPLLAAPGSPLSYLRTVLNDARQHDDARRAAVAAAGDELATAAAAGRLEEAQRAAAAAAPGSPAREAALAEARRITAARAAAVQRRRDELAAAVAECDWPEPARPPTAVVDP